MPEPMKALPMNDKEATTLLRALIDYRKLLTFSAIADSVIVAAEIHAVDQLTERLTLNVFYPAEEMEDAA